VDIQISSGGEAERRIEQPGLDEPAYSNRNSNSKPALQASRLETEHELASRIRSIATESGPREIPLDLVLDYWQASVCSPSKPRGQEGCRAMARILREFFRGAELGKLTTRSLKAFLRHRTLHGGRGGKRANRQTTRGHRRQVRHLLFVLAGILGPFGWKPPHLVARDDECAPTPSNSPNRNAELPWRKLLDLSTDRAVAVLLRAAFGFTVRDLARLRPDHLDTEGQWILHPRFAKYRLPVAGRLQGLLKQLARRPDWVIQTEDGRATALVVVEDRRRETIKKWFQRKVREFSARRLPAMAGFESGFHLFLPRAREEEVPDRQLSPLEARKFLECQLPDGLFEVAEALVFRLVRAERAAKASAAMLRTRANEASKPEDAA